MISNAAEIVFRGDLSKLDLDTEYRSTKNDPVETFYKKCLHNANLYQRAVGYFRSSVLLIIGKTLLEFARRGGRIQLICSPSLSDEDVRRLSFWRRLVGFSAQSSGPSQFLMVLFWSRVLWLRGTGTMAASRS